MPSLLKSSPKIDTSISLSAAKSHDRQENLAVFYGDDKIAGVATFNLKRNYEDVHYRLLVKGVVTTKVNDYPSGSLNNTAKVEDFTFLSASLFDGPANASSTPNSTCQTQLPFNFSLERFNEQLKETYGPGSLASSLQQLVPTLDSRDSIKKFTDNFKSSNYEYRINYHITASAYVSRRLVGRAIKGFTYTPTSAPRPPVAIEDFPDEYTLRSTELPRKAKQISRVGVVSEEPASISLSPDAKGDSTDIKLLFMLIGEGRPRLPTQCQIKATLRTTTFIMPNRAHPAMHTVQAMSRCKEGAVKVEKTFPQEFTMSLRRQWQSPESSESDSDDKSSVGEEVHTASLTFPFRIQGRDLPCPTFYSPLLSRRYAVDLSLDFDDDTTPAMKLRLPLQIIYDTHS